MDLPNLALAFLSGPQEGAAWEAAGHSSAAVWLELAGRFGTGLLLVLVSVLLVRGFLRRHLYRATGVLSPADLDAIRAEIVTAEKRTVGEIVPVVVERSDRHPGALWLAALVFTLLGSTLLGAWLPWDRPALLLLTQLLLGTVGYLTARSLPDFQRFFVSEARATEMAEEQAFQEFYRNGLHKTEAATGVLLFISLLEHRVVVLADEGVDSVVGADQWEKTTAAILAGIAGGSLRQGVIDGVRNAGDVLAEHFPYADGNRDEVPNRLILRRE